MKMTRWYFEGQEIRFISSEDKLDKHVMTNRSRFNQPDAKIIIENEYTDINQSPTTGCASCNSSSTPSPQPTLPVGNKKTKTKSKAVQLQSVPINVSNDNPTSNDLGDKPDLDLLNGVSNSVVG